MLKQSITEATPHLLFNFASVDDFLKSLSELERLNNEKEILFLNDLKLPPIVSIATLAVLVGYSPRFSSSLIHNSDNFYRIFSIKKGKSNKKRIINAPKVALKVIQKWISICLSNVLDFDDCVYGFRKGRSSVDAARVHTNAKWIYSIDIENFFPTTHISKVISALINIGYSEKSAKIIAMLCCYKENLAQGSPASPILSNLVFKNVDFELGNLAKKFNLKYTRYADDITFSSENIIFPEEIETAKDIIVKHGWLIADHKVKLAKLPNRLKVHGLLVHKPKVDITKGYRNKIRLYKFLLKKINLKESDRNKFIGHMSYVKSVIKNL